MGMPPHEPAIEMVPGLMSVAASPRVLRAVCVNPAYLEPAEPAENTRRLTAPQRQCGHPVVRNAAGKSRCPRCKQLARLGTQGKIPVRCDRPDVAPVADEHREIRLLYRPRRLTIGPAPPVHSASSATRGAETGVGQCRSVAAIESARGTQSRNATAAPLPGPGEGYPASQGPGGDSNPRSDRRRRSRS
jgi:hypothetical protein